MVRRGVTHPSPQPRSRRDSATADPICAVQADLALRIPYLASDGDDVAVRFRIAMDGKLCLYGLHRLADARHAGSVVVVEEESDAHTLHYHGIATLAGRNQLAGSRSVIVFQRTAGGREIGQVTRAYAAIAEMWTARQERTRVWGHA
jgi:hypothetical protein